MVQIVNMFINFTKKIFFFKKGNKKTFGNTCSDLEGECDDSKGLICHGVSDIKKCL